MKAMAGIKLLGLLPCRISHKSSYLVKKHFFSISKRHLNVDASEKELKEEAIVSEYVDLNVCDEWKMCDESVGTIRNRLLESMTVVPDFISETEESNLLIEIEPILKRMRYEFDHWDNAIHGFRETERSNWSELGNNIRKKVQAVAFRDPTMTLPHVHILDLDAKGYIKPHVDSIKFCGSTIAGICLLSPAVMRLRHSSKDVLFADFLLPRRCLYIMKDSSRYDFSHEVLKNEESYFQQQPIEKTRRISFIIRNQPKT